MLMTSSMKLVNMNFCSVRPVLIAVARSAIYQSLFLAIFAASFQDKELTHKGFTLELYSGNNMRVVLPVLPDPDPAFFVKELK